MMDVVLIQNGRAHEVFSRTTMADMSERWHVDVLASMIEVPSGTVRSGQLWDGARFSDPPPPQADEAVIAVEAPTPMAQRTMTFEGRTFVVANLERLTLAATLAGAAKAKGVQAGDLRWHGGATDFTWPDAAGAGVPMDVQTLEDFAFAMLQA